MTEIEKVRQWIYAKNQSIGLLKLKIRSIEEQIDMAHDWIVEQKMTKIKQLKTRIAKRQKDIRLRIRKIKSKPR